MGNIVGERFDNFVVDQINARQNLYGKGFGSTQLSPSNLLLLNNRNAWLKLASSVNVISQTEMEIDMPMGGTESINVDTDIGAQRLKDIGINNTADFLGNKLAQKTVLFNTLSEVTDNNKFTSPRSGVTKTDSLFNLRNSYGLGGTKFGISPSPGLISAEITNLNRGSIRNANITIKAFNQFQFELIELVYLRLGFTMMLEWGFDKFINNGGNIVNTGTTLIENNFFTDKPLSQLEMLQNIEYYRELYQGNYDGFFGKVVNFDWNFNKNGSYDINLKLVTLGDVIESIKTKTVAKTKTVEKIAEITANLDTNNENYEEEKERLEGLKNSTVVNNAGNSHIAQSLYENILDSALWSNENNNYFCWNNLRKSFEENGPTTGEIFDEGARESIGAGNAGRLIGALGGVTAVLSGGPENPLKNTDQYAYYMTFETLLNRVATHCVPSVGSEEQLEKQIKVAPIGDDNFCSAFPNQIAFDPKICLIRPVFTPSMVGEGNENNEKNFVKIWEWLSELKQFGFLSDDSTVLYGNIMNIYLNYDFISNCLSQNMDEDENISIYKFLSRICDGVNSSLGNFQQLEVVIRDDIFVTIQDQNSIPGIERIEPSVAPSIAPFEIFGFNTSGSVSSNFVTDFSFNTKITPQLASSISIGTTANNVSTKNYDGTAFSKWNSGLQDRFASFYVDPAETKNISGKKLNETLTNEQITAEYEAFVRRAKRPGINETEIKRQEGKFKFEKFGLSCKPERTQSGVTNRIKSPTTGYVYPSNIFGGVLTWPQYIERVISDQRSYLDRIAEKDFTREEVNKTYKNDYNWYLIRAFSGRLGSSKVKQETIGVVNPIKAQYYLMDRSFIEQGKSVFKSYIHTNIINKQFNETNIPSNTIGFIPADLGLTFKGLSGIKIYQQLAVRQDFLPKQYPKALKFLIKGVNHSISNNDWSTNLTTLSIPNVEAKLNLDGTPKFSNTLLSDGLLNGPTPNATALRVYLRGGALVINNAFYEKDNEISNNGDISSNLKDTVIRLLQSINSSIPNTPSPEKQIEIRITAGNDTSHSGSSSRHPKGNALDFTLGSPTSPTWGEKINNSIYNREDFSGKERQPKSRYTYIDLIDKILSTFIKNNPGTNYINEYYNPSSGASGPHFHFSVKSNFVET